MTREEKEQIGRYVLQMARFLADGCYQQEMLLKAAHIIDEALEQESTLDKIRSEIDWDEVDKQEITKSVVILDLFTKTYCRYQNDYERFDDLKFRCGECPFSRSDGSCMCKEFKNKYAPDYRDFGSMGDL